MTPSLGVLLMAYGSPATLDDVAAYLTHIRGGRVPSDEQVEELRARYERIGGRSPLIEITRAQAAGVERLLAQTGIQIRTYVGMKHAPPFIADAVAEAARGGERRLLGIALAPHYSRMSIGSYRTAAEQAAARHAIAFQCVDSWHVHPEFVRAIASRVQEAQRATDGGSGVCVVFTAHSLPTRIKEWNDPYPEQLRQSCEEVADAVGLAQWRFAYQSASHTGEPWLGPDVLEVIRDLRREGHRECIVCPVGFVADHLEILYDLDVEAAAVARTLGMRLIRARSLNESADFVAALTALVRAHLPEGVPG